MPCESGQESVSECQGCFDAAVEENFFSKHGIWPAVVTGVIVAIATGITVHRLNKSGIKTA